MMRIAMRCDAARHRFMKYLSERVSCATLPATPTFHIARAAACDVPLFA
jgi:hypothetical protein